MNPIRFLRGDTQKEVTENPWLLSMKLELAGMLL